MAARNTQRPQAYWKTLSQEFPIFESNSLHETGQLTWSNRE